MIIEPRMLLDLICLGMCAVSIALAYKWGKDRNRIRKKYNKLVKNVNLGLRR